MILAHVLGIAGPVVLVFRDYAIMVFRDYLWLAFRHAQIL